MMVPSARQATVQVDSPDYWELGFLGAIDQRHEGHSRILVVPGLSGSYSHIADCRNLRQWSVSQLLTCGRHSS